MRLLFALCLLLPATFLVHAQEREKTRGEASATVTAQYTLERAAYSRELWVGIPAGEVTGDDLRKALAKACDDTTSVAVIEPEIAEGTAEQRETLAVLAARRALSALWAEVSVPMYVSDSGAAAFDSDWNDTRVVLVGVMESCGMALRIANAKDSRVAGVVLIDPPVDDLPNIEAARNIGVDVFLHPRSESEFTREEEVIVDRLGKWGASARVLRGGSHFDNLKERVAYAWSQLRGYAPLYEGPATAFDLAGKMADFNVICVGELHGNPGAHRVELEVLRRMAEEGSPLALSTEQFERDTQETLDAYLAGTMTEKEFREKSRPWPNYADYRPLIEFCKANKIPVIAGNIPRRLASRVYKEGVDVIEKFSDDEKSWTAAELKALPGAYKDKFMGAMGGMGGHGDALERMYAAQCIKDDTMAESIANWLKANPEGRVLHINGVFHSGNGLGVPEKLEAMMDEVQIGLVSCVQDAGDDDAAPDEWLIKVPGSRPMRQVPEHK